MATRIYLLLNFVRILLFAWYVLKIEKVAHLEHRAHRDGVDGITFFATAGPVFLVCALGSCFWAAKVFFDHGRIKNGESLKALLVAACAWAAVLYSMRFLPDLARLWNEHDHITPWDLAA